MIVGLGPTPTPAPGPTLAVVVGGNPLWGVRGPELRAELGGLLVVVGIPLAHHALRSGGRAPPALRCTWSLSLHGGFLLSGVAAARLARRPDVGHVDAHALGFAPELAQHKVRAHHREHAIVVLGLLLGLGGIRWGFGSRRRGLGEGLGVVKLAAEMSDLRAIPWLIARC